MKNILSNYPENLTFLDNFFQKFIFSILSKIRLKIHFMHGKDQIVKKTVDLEASFNHDSVMIRS